MTHHRHAILRIGGRIIGVAQWPTSWAYVATLVCGVLTVLNQATFDLPTAAKTAVTIGLGVFAYLKIGPALGPKFQAALHLKPAIAHVIGVVMLVLMIVTQQSTGLPERAIIIGVLQVLGGLGFAPAYVPTA